MRNPELGLGIDTGGTYTDTVILDFRTGAIVDHAKALTTRENLSIGIGNSIRKLKSLVPSEIKLTSISTTLATNAIVEGKGGRVGLILIGYDPELVRVYGTESGLNFRDCRFVAGRHNLEGERVEEFDAEAFREIVMAEKNKVDAFAVSEYLGVRNPEYELAARSIIQSISGLPVVLSHELTGQLNSLKRAATSALNARLIPVIRELITFVEAVLRKIGIQSPIVVVKGDGSVMSAEMAMERPIETILSGPAASAVGAHYLTGRPDSVVVDMGGTTTDMAILRNGRPRVVPSGARVGGFLTSVVAADLRTAGIGGDSHISFVKGREFTIGPRRVIPLCVGACEFPQLKTQLDELAKSNFRSSLINITDFLRLSRRLYMSDLSPDEVRLIEVLKKGPASLVRLARTLRMAHPYLVSLLAERLEGLGVVERIGLTPTDLLHVSGQYTEWDAHAAYIGACIFARELGTTPETLVRLVLERMVHDISKEIVTKALSDELGDHEPKWSPLSQLITDKALSIQAVKENSAGLLKCSFKLGVPIIAIGAPVRAYLPEVARALHTELIIPEYAEVANAVGAITGCVAVAIEILISPVYNSAGITGYTLHSPKGRLFFKEIEEAVAYGRSSGINMARSEAARAGASDIDVKVERSDREGSIAGEGDGKLLLETILRITAVGRPRMGEADSEAAPTAAHDLP